MLDCKICGTSSLWSVFKHDNVPRYCLNYLNTRNEALAAPSHLVDFMRCQNCGFLFNTNYQQLSYQVEDESSRAFSPVFSNYLREVARVLTKNLKYEISRIVEIGAGDGSFAEALINFRPGVEYFAYDPSWNKSEVNGNLI